MTYDGGNSYAYDFQGRPVTVNSTSFIYDAFGRVAEEDVPGTVTHILYQPDGSRFATLQNGSIQNYFMPMVNGMVEVFNASGEQYIRHADWLGSSRLATNPNGNPVYDRAYAPFGETYAETGTADRFFTGNTQDVIKGQTGIYDFLFREHSAGMGRWLSPDPAGLAAVDITNPQTWNRYAYVGNNPLSRIDPRGLCSQPAGLQEGQIGLCIDAYISAATLSGPPFVTGFGDNRGPSGSGGTYRAEFQFIYDVQSNTMFERAAPGTSKVLIDLPEIPDFYVSAEGTINQYWSSSSTADSTTGFLYASACNGFCGLPGSPGAILLSTSVTCSATGCSIDGGSSSAYPSWEAWGYQVGKKPQNIFNVPEGSINQLGKWGAKFPKGYYGGGGGGAGGSNGYAYSTGGFFLNGTSETGYYGGFFINFGAPTPFRWRSIK